MTIGDILAVISGVLATGATLAAIFLTIALLFRPTAERAQTALTEQTGRTFGTGFAVAIVAGTFGLILSNQANGLLKLIGLGILIGLFALAAVGSAGLGLLVADRMRQLDRRVGPLKALWRSYLLIVCAGALPFIGWLVVFPFALTFSLGAGLAAIVGRKGSRAVGVAISAAPASPAFAYDMEARG